MNVFYYNKFLREYKKLSSEVRKIAETREKIFKINPFDTRLKTHRLTGSLKDYWSFSIDYKNRIIFQFADENTVWFYSVGSHDIYK